MGNSGQTLKILICYAQFRMAASQKSLGASLRQRKPLFPGQLRLSPTRPRYLISEPGAGCRLKIE
jgi:hypothetical protein